MARLPDVICAGPIELRRWQPTDVDALVAALSASLPELQLWMPWARDPITIEAYAEIVERFHADFDAGAQFVYGMFPSGGADVVGGCGLHFRLGPRVVEIGYWVRTDHHRRGYATAAARALTTTAFSHLDDIGEVHIRMDKANVASARVPARLGYTLAGEDEDDHLRWIVDRAAWQPT
jgi:RimJ/RimL family protein N-acetyltransferase